MQRLSDSGRDFTQFMRDLSAHLRHLFVVQTLGEVPDSFSVTAEHTDRLAEQAERLSQGEILRAIDFLAAAIAAVKDGSEPRIQLEMALLKATQPQADLSLQALMFRIEQLEARLGGEAPASAREASAPADGAPERPAATPPAPTRSAAGGPVAAVAAEPEAQADAAPVGAIELEQLQTVWPAVAEAVCEENGMLGAALGAARPVSRRGGPAHGRLPDRRRLREEEGRGEPRPGPAGAARSHRASRSRVAYELREDAAPGGPVLLGEEELIERLRAEFAAEEVFDEEGG